MSTATIITLIRDLSISLQALSAYIQYLKWQQSQKQELGSSFMTLLWKAANGKAAEIRISGHSSFLYRLLWQEDDARIKSAWKKRYKKSLGKRQSMTQL